MSARFSDDELLTVTQLASTQIDTGLWVRLQRDSGADYDRIVVHLPPERDAHFRIERDPTGWTYLLVCSPNDWRLLVCGTFDECVRAIRR